MSTEFKTLGAAAAEVVEDLRFRLLCQALHSHGPRVLTEFLAEIGAERSILTLIEEKIGRYIDEGFDPKLVGADTFPAIPLHQVRAWKGEADER